MYRSVIYIFPLVCIYKQENEMAKTRPRPQLDKLANGPRKPMSRTSGVARRAAKPYGEKGALLNGNQVKSALKYGAPLTGSASGVKNITLKDVGETLTQGIVTLGKKGLQFDPASLAMALPIGKVAKAAGALRAAGKVGRAGQLEARIASKVAGKEYGKTVAYLKKFGSESGSGQLRSPGERVGSKAYPKSYGQFGQRAPVSELATTKTPSAGTFRIGPKVSGYKVVDNRYRYNMSKPRVGRQDRGAK